MLESVKKYNLVFPKELIKNIYDLKNQGMVEMRSNILGWQSPQYTNTKNILWIDDFVKQCMSIAELQIFPTYFWFNISPKNAYHRWHDHGQAVKQAGVFYIQIPENSGNIEFKENDKIYSIIPYEGLLLVFPKIKHRVLPNNSDQDRISMSFNIFDK